MKLTAVLLVGLVLTTPPLGAGSQQWTVLPGAAIGPLRIGMTARDVGSLLGRPDSREGDRLWTYEATVRVRVEFQEGRVRTITTWDPRAKTPQGLRVGSSHGDVIQVLGPNPETWVTSTGVWVYRPSLGLAVFMESGVAAAFTVMLPQSSGVGRDPHPARPSPPLAAAPSPSQAGPAIVIENVGHKIDRSVTITGTIRNAGQFLRKYVDVTVTAKTFRGAAYEGKPVEVATNLLPGESRKFEVKVERDLWESYTVRVARYYLQASSEPISSVSGKISQGEYIHWASENLGGGFRAYASPGSSSGGYATVSVSLDYLPTYRWATVSAVIIRVRWYIIPQEGLGQHGVTEAIVTPPRMSTTITLSHHPGPFSVMASASVLRVIWHLNF